MAEHLTETAGVDLGDKYSDVCVLDEDGEVVERARVRTTQAGVERFFLRSEPMLVVMEVGTHSPWVSRLVEELGHTVLVANPRRVRLIAESQHKRDAADAELLARLGRVDPKLLSPIEHRSSAAQSDLAMIRSRAAMVRARTTLVNCVRGQVKASGYRMPSCGAERFGKLVDDVPPSLAPAMEATMNVIRQLTIEIKAYDKCIEHLCDTKYPDTQLLRQVGGVGAVTSLAYVLTLEDPNRYKKSRTVGAFLGLTPGKRQSGAMDPQCRITKAGDPYLRQLLVGSAQYILGPFGDDCDLRRWGLSHAVGGSQGAKKKAVVATARKLAVLLHRLWTTGEEYEPLRNSEPKNVRTFAVKKAA